MMPSRSCNGVRPDADKYCGNVLEMFLMTSFSNGEGAPYGWLPMGSPGVFIHSGTLGGRLAVFSLAARASRPARPPAMTAPPNKAPPSLRNRRRDAEVTFLSMSVGLVILVLRAKSVCLE